MTAKFCEARARSDRPVPVSALEARARLTVPAREPETAAVTPTLPAAAAAMSAGLAKARRALAEVAATESLSW